MQVDFEGAYPIEGAKEVATLMTRYVSRALRTWSSQQAARKQLMVAGGKNQKKPGGLGTRVASVWKKVKGKGKGRAPSPDEREPRLPIVHLAVGADAFGSAQIVAQAQEQVEQCVGVEE